MTVDLAAELPFALGTMQVRPSTREVQFGGAVQTLEPRIMQVLVVLARHRGTVVSRQALNDACWENRSVVDDALNRCISAIRRLSLASAAFTISTVARVGYKLEEVAERAAPSTPSAASKRERRHVTVLSCDLVRPAGITSQLDPEEWHAIVTNYHRVTASAIASFGGHAARARGESIAASFGFPRAREDAAERAVRAGLEIVRRTHELNAGVAAEITLAVRVGIHAGSVVVELTSGGETELFGEASDIAALVQAVAATDTVVITSTVHALVANFLAVEAREPLCAEGLAAPIPLYRALATTHPRGRIRIGRALTPFVGREPQLQTLESRLARASDVEGQFVLVTGEPGVGKSRLIEEFRSRVQDVPHRWIGCAGAALFANTPFHALVELLEEGLELRDEEAEQRAARLEQALADAGLRLSEALPLIADVLNLPIPQRFARLMFAPDERRKRLFAAVLGWIFSATRDQPVILVIEDVHWVDPSTLELIQMLAARGANARLLLLCTARPGFQPPWAASTHHTAIGLDRLDLSETRELVASRLTEGALSPEAVEAIIERSDGIPLFAEELTRSALERRGAHEIPSSLHDSLAARLDCLEEAKPVAQLCAVIGREFSYALLRALSPLAEAELQSTLDKLTSAELIEARGVAPSSDYSFRHTLIRDAAYEALLKSERRELHARVARAIHEKCPALATAQPEVLARHFSDAGETEPAIDAWTRTAQAARARRAHREAEVACHRALELLATLPESPERDVREMELVSDLGSALQILRGEAAPEAVAALARCLALADKGGNLQRQCALLVQSCSQAMVTGNLRDAALLADRALELARREGSAGSLARAHQARFFALYYLGDPDGAEKHFSAWKQIWDAGGRADSHRVRDGLSYASLRALISGDFDLARARLREVDEFALRTGDPFEIPGARCYGAYLHIQLADYESAEAAASQALTMSEERGIPALAALARVALGCALAQRGKPRDGVGWMRRGIGELVAVDYRLPVPGLLYLLAEGLMLDGALEEGLVVVTDALGLNPQEIAYRPEGLLIRGKLRCKLGQKAAAIADFEAAIALAKTTGARLFQLRAATAFARLLSEDGDDQAARSVLAPICDFFVTGTDVLHVREAKSLLATLQSRAAE